MSCFVDSHGKVCPFLNGDREVDGDGKKESGERGQEKRRERKLWMVCKNK